MSMVLFALLLITGKEISPVWGAASEDSGGDKKGSITLLVSKDASGVELTLWKVADYQDGKYILANGFENSGISVANLNDASQAQEAADQFTAYAIEKGIKSYGVQKADESGQIIFDNLPAALYLAGETSGADIMKVQGALVPVPYLGENGSAVYDAQISPKYSFPGGAVLVHKVDEDGNFVGQAEFVLQQKIYVDSENDIPDDAESGSDEGGTFYWKEFSADLVSDENGQIVITDMPKGDYRVIETRTPAGYIPSSQPYEFSIETAGQVKEVDGLYQAVSGEVAEVTVVNQRTSTSVNKVDEDGNYVSGAKFVVKDSEGNVLKDEDGKAKYSFTSSQTPYELKGIPAGDYYLSEVEPPQGFSVARDVKFTVSDQADAVNTVTMVDEKKKTTNGSLTVTKYLYDEEDKEIETDKGVFYVALFEDEECTQRVSQVAPIEFDGDSAASVTFTDLDLDQAYYVAETDEYGIVLDAEMYDGGSFAPEYPEDQLIEIERQEPEKDFYFNNRFYELPDGFYYKGVISITKKVLLNGEESDSDDTFYAGIFTDEDYTQMYGDKPVELKMDGSSSATVDVPVMIGDSKDAVVNYYVTETDKDGVPLENADDLVFSFVVENGEVELNYEENRAEVVITNDFAEESPTPTPEKITVTPGPSDTPDTPGTPGTPGTNVKTGDDTPIALYVMILLLAVCTAAAVLIRKNGKKKDKK